MCDAVLAPSAVGALAEHFVQAERAELRAAHGELLEVELLEPRAQQRSIAVLSWTKSV